MRVWALVGILLYRTPWIRMYAHDEAPPPTCPVSWALRSPMVHRDQAHGARSRITNHLEFDFQADKSMFIGHGTRRRSFTHSKVTGGWLSTGRFRSDPIWKGVRVTFWTLVVFDQTMGNGVVNFSLMGHLVPSFSRIEGHRSESFLLI